MLVPNRHQSAESYRYGFQGQEKDDKIKGEGNSINYTFRMHDPRVGRFFAVDPLFREYPHYTPYSFSGNKVIHAVELEGLEEYIVTTNTDKRLRHFKVRPKDNLSLIAETTGVALNDIIKWNDITNADLIYPNQTLLLFDASNLTMSYFTKSQQSDWLNEFLVELATTNENGFSIQSQADFYLKVEGGAGLYQLLRGAPKLISRQPAPNIKPKDYYGNSTPIVKAAPKVSTISKRQIIIDESVSPKVAEKLQASGYNVKVFEKGTKDSEIIKFAKKNDAIVVTNNIKDFKNQGINTMKTTQKQTVDDVVEGVIKADNKYGNGAIPNNISLPEIIKEKH